MKEQDPRSQRQDHRRTEERIAEIQRELVLGEDCAGTAPETWKSFEEELIDELRELELSLLKERRQGRWRA